MDWEGSIVRGSSALRRLEEERSSQLANKAKQYLTLMKENRLIIHFMQLEKNIKKLQELDNIKNSILNI